MWQGGIQGEPELLRSCYQRSLALAKEKEVRTVAFPGISTGVYGYPKGAAARIALEVMQAECGDFKEVIACCFSQQDAVLYRTLCSDYQFGSGDDRFA